MIVHFCGLIKKLKRIVVQISAAVCRGGALRDETRTAEREIISVHEEKKQKIHHINCSNALWLLKLLSVLDLAWFESDHVNLAFYYHTYFHVMTSVQHPRSMLYKKTHACFV